MGIRRWLSGTLRPDDVETDSITADSATVNGTTTTNALEASTATIGDGDTISDLEYGQISLPGPDAASDNGWDTTQANTKTVSFDNSFNSIPSVVTGFYGKASAGVIVAQDSVTKTDFRIVIRNYSTNVKTGETFNIDWVAVA